MRKRVVLWSDTRPTAFLKTGVRVRGVLQKLSDLHRQPLYTLIGSTLSGSSGRHPSNPPLAPLSIDTASQKQRVERVSPTHLDIQAAKLHEPVTGSVLHDTPNYYGTVPVALRTAVGVWNPTSRSICSMLHAADIRGRWEAVVHARLRKWKKRCRAKARNERWYERKCQREQDGHMTQIDAVKANIQEWHDGLKRYKGEMVYKLRQKLTLKHPKPNVCGVEIQRELIAPGRTQYSTRLATDNSNPAMLLYLVLLLLAGSLFVAVNASPELNHLVNTGIGSRAIVVLSAITVMQGCKLHNGSMIAAALMATWYCLANTGNAAAIGGGPTYWIDLLIPFELRMACLLMVMCLATVIKAERPTRRAAASVVSTVKDIKESRSLNKKRMSTELVSKYYLSQILNRARSLTSQVIFDLTRLSSISLLHSTTRYRARARLALS